MHYMVEELVRVAKRDNNTIRPYLFVNPLQGKHIPADPVATFEMCKALADIVNDTYPNDDLFVMGFAETATGIASVVSQYLNNILFYQNTTREYREGEECLFFTESHSHATDQRLRSERLADCIRRVDRIIFVDDEVTTGNTIEKLIKIIKEKYQVIDTEFSIVSILNSMTAGRIKQLQKGKIDCLYLAELPFEYKKDSVESIQYDASRDTIIKGIEKSQIDLVPFNATVNPRTTVRFSEYKAEIQRFLPIARRLVQAGRMENILILGTEEFMYPALCVGKDLLSNKMACRVRIHATTRSPIIPSDAIDYPLYHRYQIRSLYDDNRRTYIYNLEQYDKVLIITDSAQEDICVADLVKALQSVGNQDITLMQWLYH